MKEALPVLILRFKTTNRITPPEFILHAIAGKKATYQVSGISAAEMIGLLPEHITNDLITDGGLLSPSTHKFVEVAKDGTCTIEITADATAWLEKHCPPNATWSPQQTWIGGEGGDQ